MVLAVALGCTGTDGAATDAPPPTADASVDAAIDAGVDAPPTPCDMAPMSTGVSTLAGCPGSGAVDGPRGTARFANPVNVLVDSGGDVLVADFDNDRIRRVTPDGEVTTLVMRADLRRPFGLALLAGALYVSTDDNDRGQHSTTTGTIWRIDPVTGAAVVVARDLGRPRGLLALSDGRLAMADYLHHTVSVLDPATGAVVALAGALDQAGFADGRGAAARFSAPYDLARLADGRIAVTDLGNHRVRAITLAGDVTTLAGTGARGGADGPATAATFGAPQALASDAAGRLFVSDLDGFTIRMLADGKVTTVAGSGVGGWQDGALRDAQFWGLEGIALSPDGATLWVADGSRGEDVPFHRVRRVLLP
ncbi:MAG: hypothetical protein IPL61_08905 [Myxococcales bacterium]|nr:hypothetical protein [Myxococcales bacterium]